MGFSISYRLMEPVTAEMEEEILDALKSLRTGRTWLACEPPFLQNDGGVLTGSSKPNFMQHPDDIQSAKSEDLPDGTLIDLLEILGQLSRRFNLDWEISHDYSDGPLGYIRDGEIDHELRAQCEAFDDLAGEIDLEGFDLDDL